MRWTTGVGILVAALALSGCYYGYRTASWSARYSADSRPDRTYYCYDCHGYRFFDPYYDYCSYYGFRYRWDEHPRVSVLYRQRYVRIREAHPEYGRYRYQPGYRGTARYRDPESYEEWRGKDDDERSGYERRRDRGDSRGRREEWKERKERKGSHQGKKGARERKPEREREGDERRSRSWREGA
jgi:hypothetical protein